MAGLIVSASTGALKPLLVKLATLMGEEFAKLKNLRKEMKFIGEELTSMKDALDSLSDLDELDKQTKGWRDQVREMSYDIEDIIDDFMHHIGEKSKIDGFGRKTARLLKKLRARHQIAGQIKEIKTLVLDTSARRPRYKLGIPPSSSVVNVDPRVKTLYEKAANLVGMEGPKNELVDWLIHEDKQLKVVSIVGFGGLGKTTLANVVYAGLKGDYDCCAFVPVAQKPDIPKLLRSLLSQLGIEEPSIHSWELNVLLDKLREHLQAKRYLIVIDDLWSVPGWDIIKCAFPENDHGSRVIVTTRIQEVAMASCCHHHDYILQMKPLSNEDSRRLFFSRTFGTEEACLHQLRDVSVEILKKCGGLPLAIISVSSLLDAKGANRKERWEHVQNSLGSMSGTKLTLEGMRQILNLSYKELPCHLKTCLLYLGMYPEDYTIRRCDLERQWMAEGFVSKENGQDAAKVARKYFNELVNRSLIQPAEFDNIGSVTQCKVHDMMLDLILLKSAEENFLTVVDDPQAITGLDYMPRRLSICLNGASNSTILHENISMSKVRSVMIFRGSQDIPPLSQFKFLRVLFIGGHGSIDLNGLYKLYQLRYLWISRYCCYKLPAQIRGLKHLETLDVVRCSSIPSDIVYLPRLLHLDVGYNKGLPDGIGNAKSLRYLCQFDLAGNSLGNIEGLGELINLRYLTVACNSYGRDLPDDMERRVDVLCSSLGKLCGIIEYLDLSLGRCMDGLMALSPPPHRLQELRIPSSTSRFSRVPDWMGGLHNLSMLVLVVDELLKDSVVTLAGMSSLVHLDLNIQRDPQEMIIIYGTSFPVLKQFVLTCGNRISHLTFQAGAMPKLQSLELRFKAPGWDERYELRWRGLEFASPGSKENLKFKRLVPELKARSCSGPAGIDNLLALEEVSAMIYCGFSAEYGEKSAESLRHAIYIHPSHPRIEIKLKDSFWVYSEG